MSCRETTELLPFFFDGELEGHQMRAVELHTADCDECRGEIRELEQIRNAFAANLAARVDQMDLSALWPAIERRLPAPTSSQPSRWQQWREAWQSAGQGWRIGVPALATAAAVAALAFALFSGGQPPVEVAAVDSAADYLSSIERLDTDADSVDVFHDPETRSMLLWVGDTGPITEDLQ